MQWHTCSRSVPTGLRQLPSDRVLCSCLRYTTGCKLVHQLPELSSKHLPQLRPRVRSCSPVPKSAWNNRKLQWRELSIFKARYSATGTATSTCKATKHSCPSWRPNETEAAGNARVVPFAWKAENSIHSTVRVPTHDSSHRHKLRYSDYWLVRGCWSQPESKAEFALILMFWAVHNLYQN